VRVPAAEANRTCVVCGALDSVTGQVHWQFSLRKNNQAFVPFLEQLRHTWPEERLVVVLDNVGYHKSRQTLTCGSSGHTSSTRSFCQPTPRS
jgi:hypothetical protein